MKVYVVIEQGGIVGVYANKEEAEKAKEHANFCSAMEGGYSTCYVQECVVK